MPFLGKIQTPCFVNPNCKYFSSCLPKSRLFHQKLWSLTHACQNLAQLHFNLLSIFPYLYIMTTVCYPGQTYHLRPGTEEKSYPIRSFSPQRPVKYCCVHTPHSSKQWGVPRTATTRFTFLGWKRARETYSVFLIFVLFTTIQVQHISVSKRTLLQPRRSTYTAPKAATSPLPPSHALHLSHSVSQLLL